MCATSCSCPCTFRQLPPQSGFPQVTTVPSHRIASQSMRHLDKLMRKKANISPKKLVLCRDFSPFPRDVFRFHSILVFLGGWFCKVFLVIDPNKITLGHDCKGTAVCNDLCHIFQLRLRSMALAAMKLYLSISFFKKKSNKGTKTRHYRQQVYISFIIQT